MILSDITEQIRVAENNLKDKIEINDGDWVTINRNYAKQHGEDNLDNKYIIRSKIVKASQLYTDGNSIHEFGYNI